MKKFFYFSFPILLALASISQLKAAEIKKVVLGYDSLPAVGAIAIYIEMPDSIASVSTITDESGKFRFDIEPQKDDFIIISNTGYESYILPYFSFYSNEPIYLDLKYNELQNFTVTARQGQLKMNNGKFHYDISNLAEVARTPYDAIKYLPLVSQENKNIFKILNRETTILINGKKRRDGQSATLNYLLSLPLDAVKDVEINISKDIANGSETSINFIVDDPFVGIRGNASANIDVLTNGGYSNSESLWIGYNSPKLQFSGNLSWKDNYSKSNDEKKYLLKDSGLKYDSHHSGTSKQENLSLNLNMAYILSRISAIGLSVDVGSQRGKIEYTQNTDYDDNNIISRGITNGTSKIPFPSPYLLSTLYWELLTDSKNSRINVDLDFWIGKAKTLSTMDNAIDSQPISTLIQDDKNKTYGFDGKLNYFWIFNNRSYLALGYIFSNLHKNQDFYTNLENQSNDFRYNEITNQIFAQYTIQFNDYMYANIGSQFMHTSVDSKNYTSEESFKNNYFNFVPTFSFTASLKGGLHILSANLSSWLTQPSGQELNPFRIWQNANEYVVGDPYSEAFTSYKMSLDYVLLNDFSFSVSFSPYSDLKGATIVPEDGDIIRQSYGIVGKSMSMGFYASWSKFLFNRFWRPNISFSVSREQLKGNPGYEFINSKNTNVDLRVRNNLIISRKKDFSLSLQWQYRNPITHTYGTGNTINNLSFIVSKGWQIKNDYLSADVSFGGNLSRNTINLDNNLIYMYSNISDPYRIGISIIYSFGKDRIRGAANRNSSSGLSRTQN